MIGYVIAALLIGFAGFMVVRALIRMGKGKSGCSMNCPGCSGGCPHSRAGGENQ